MTLRWKLILGSCFPLAMLLAVGIYSSSQMRFFGRRIDAVLSQNQRSINYAVNMLESLEQMDLLTATSFPPGSAGNQAALLPALEKFDSQLKLAKGNISLSDETAILDSLEKTLLSYSLTVAELSPESLTGDETLQLTGFVSTLRRLALQLGRLNTEALGSTGTRLSGDAARAALPGDLIMAAALLFALMFIWLSQTYIVKPVMSILGSLHRMNRGGDPEEVKVTSNDELRELAAGVWLMATRSNPAARE